MATLPFSRRWRWRRLPVLLFETLGAVAALLLLVVGILATWLAAGPIEVNWLTASLTDMLNEAAAPLSVTIAGTKLRWDPGHPAVDLVAERLVLTDPRGKRILTLPSIAISLSVQGLLAGELRPTRLTVIAPNLRIDRSPTGDLGFAEASPDGNGAAGEAAPGEPWPQLLRSLSLPPQRDDTFGGLRQVSIERARIVVNDRMTGIVWRLDDGTANLARSAGALDLGIAGRLGIGDAAADIKAAIHLDTATRMARFDAGFGGLDPATLAAALPPRFQQLGEVRVPLAGHVSGTFDIGTMQPLTLQAMLKGGGGTIVDPALATGRLDLKQFELDASYAGADRRLVLDRAFLDLGGATLEAKGHAAPIDPEVWTGQMPAAPVALAGTVAIHDVPLDRFAAIWPPGLAGDARSWIIANLTKGTMRELAADVSADLVPGPSSQSGPNLAVTHASATGQFTVADATVDYLSGLPKLQGVDATVKFTGQRMDFAITDGHLLRLRAPGGTVVIDGLDGPHQHIVIDLGIRGPTGDVLQVLNAKRLQYAKAVGLDPAAVAGDIDGTLHFAFELKKDLPLDEIDYGASAKLTGLGIDTVALGQDLRQGNFDLVLERTRLSLAGAGLIGGIPATLDWTERIAGENGPLSEVHAKATMDDAARQRFGVDVIPEIVQGPVDVDLDYLSIDKRHSSAALKLGLAPATLAVALAEWSKPPGDPASASLTLRMVDDHIIAIDGLHAAAAGLSLDAGLTLDQGSIIHAAINHLTLGQSEVAGTVDHPAGGAAGQPWTIRLRGPAMDLTPIRRQLAKDTTPPEAGGPSLLLDLDTDRMTVGDNRDMHQVDLHATVDRHAFTSAKLAATIGLDGRLAATLDPVDAGGDFSLTTDDFGNFFRLAGISDDVVGGSLTLTGHARQDGDARRFSGHAEGKDYRLVHMPFVARLGSLVSLQAISSLLAGKGIPFTALKADFDFERGRLDLTHGRAYGGAFGLNADGWFDTKAGTLSLQGTLVPAYTLNSALGGVPVLGNLILGGEGQGLFGANVAIYGPIEEPTISVNALSALAPGFLRKLFLFDAPGAGAEPPPERGQ